jgi:hypothetical protein
MHYWLILLVVAAFPAQAGIEPGNWELSATTQIRGIREPTHRTRVRCLTPEDARDPRRLFGSSAERCELTNQSDTGSLLTFDVACDARRPLRGSGSLRYDRDSLEGDIELKGSQFSARSHITGRRIGEC